LTPKPDQASPGDRAPRQRIVIVGTTGSGKTTLARRAAEIIGGRHIELDALYHGPGWVPADPEVFRERVRKAIAGQERWVTCGGYRGHVREITWPLANQIVWIDLPFRVTFSRMFRRTLLRVARKEELWNGNRESLRNTFASRDSLLLFAIQYRNKYREEYPSELSDPRLAHVDVVRLRRQRDVAAWLRGLEAEWQHAPQAPNEQ
jgi:adenylate kinase family enzyme